VEAPEPTPDQLEATLKRSVAALEEADVPYLLGGSLAAWARGAPLTRNDLDLMVRPADAERALEVLVDAGMGAEHPPEHWLVKAWDGDVLVDLIHSPEGLELTDEVFARGDNLRVLGMNVDVMALEDVIVTKLLAIDEKSLRYDSLLQIARALRERIDWAAVRARTTSSPYSRPFFVLLEELGVIEPEQAPPAGETEVRVIGTAER